MFWSFYTRGIAAGRFVLPASQPKSAHDRTAGSSRRIATVLLASSALSCVLPTAVDAQQLIQNSSFETVSNPGAGANTFCIAAFWTTVGACNAGYQYNTAANVTPPTGNISINVTVQNGISLSQAVNVTLPGSYTFAFKYTLVGGNHSATASVGTNAFVLTQAQAGWTSFASTATLASGATNVTFTNAFGGIANFSIDDVTLTLLRAASLSSMLPVNAPVNPSNVVRALDTAANGQGLLPGAFGNLLGLPGLQLQSAASQMSGELGANVAQSGIAATDGFITTMFESAFDNAARAGAGPGFTGGNGALGYAASDRRTKNIADAYAAVMPRDRFLPVDQPRWTSWGSAYGGGNRVSGDTVLGSNQTNNRIWGVVGGADYKPGADTRLGFALGGGGANFSVDNGFGSGRSDIVQLGAYARHDIGAAYLAGAAAHSWQNVNTDRTVTVAGFDTLHASFNTSAWAARLESGSRFATPAVGITPYAALQATTFHLPGYGETATAGTATVALNYAAHDVTAARSELGIRWDKTLLTADETAFVLKARTAWSHNWNNDRSAIASFQSLPGVSSFTVNGAAPDADSALLSFSAGVKFNRGWSLTASYEGEHARRTASNAGRGTLKYEW